MPQLHFEGFLTPNGLSSETSTVILFEFVLLFENDSFKTFLKHFYMY